MRPLPSIGSPRSRALSRASPRTPPLTRSPARDRTIPLAKTLGRCRWKQVLGSHRQGRVENTCFRDTSIIGDGLRARSPARQGSAVGDIPVGLVDQPEWSDFRNLHTVMDVEAPVQVSRVVGCCHDDSGLGGTGVSCTTTRHEVNEMRRTLRALGVIVLCGVAAAAAQPRSTGWGRPELPYDGRLTFVRLRWTSGTYGAPVMGQGPNFWLHEFPRAEQNLMAVLDDVTLIDAKTDGSLILTSRQSESIQAPHCDDVGARFLGDDGRRGCHGCASTCSKVGSSSSTTSSRTQWDNFAAQMGRVIPGARWVPMEATHPIFNSFFRIQQIDVPHPFNHHLYGYKPEYFGLFEDNDPSKRLMAIVNYNTNLAEYWQMAGTGFFPIESENIGFRLGVNYMLYGMTH